MIPIVLVTGFLGCGKTTLLKRFVDEHGDRRFLYLVNEFNAHDVDGALIRSEGAEVVVIPGGSIFCNCLVTDFIRHMTDVRERFPDLEAVIIEASGMANPKVIEQMLAETRLDADYRLSHVLTVIDPVSFHKLIDVLPNLTSQVEAADTVVINKTDLASSAELDACTTAVAELNGDADVRTAEHCAVELELLPERSSRGLEGQYAPCRDPDFETFTTDQPIDRTALEEVIGRFADTILRVKGHAELDGTLQRIELASGRLETTPALDARAAALVWIVRGGEGELVRDALRG